jgi:hypothetical protein
MLFILITATLVIIVNQFLQKCGSPPSFLSGASPSPSVPTRLDVINVLLTNINLERWLRDMKGLQLSVSVISGVKKSCSMAKSVGIFLKVRDAWVRLRKTCKGSRQGEMHLTLLE